LAVVGVETACAAFARFARRVVLAANELPAINDVCASELRALLLRIAGGAGGGIDSAGGGEHGAQADDVHGPERGDDRSRLGALAAMIETGRLTVCSTGADLPVIDLRQVSAELQLAAADADLVILVGEQLWSLRQTLPMHGCMNTVSSVETSFVQ
jgi:hypothetical protein